MIIVVYSVTVLLPTWITETVPLLLAVSHVTAFRITYSNHIYRVEYVPDILLKKSLLCWHVLTIAGRVFNFSATSHMILLFSWKKIIKCIVSIRITGYTVYPLLTLFQALPFPLWNGSRQFQPSGHQSKVKIPNFIPIASVNLSVSFQNL